MVKPGRKVAIGPLHLLSGALLLSAHLLAWPAGSPSPSPAATPERMVLLASRETHPRWEKLSPEEREAIRDRRKQYEALPPAERQRIRDIHERYQELSPEQRRELQEKWRSQRGSDESRRRHPRTRD